MLQREILLACPEPDMDLYKLHQMVWQFVKKMSVVSRPEFQFRQDDAIIRVRGTQFKKHGSMPVRELDCTEGAVTNVAIDLAAITRAAFGQTSVPKEMLGAWSTLALAKAGFEVLAMDARPFTRVGHKLKSDCDHRITIPVARVNARLRVKDRVRAEYALMHGVGRAKRFGMGMILPV